MKNSIRIFICILFSCFVCSSMHYEVSAKDPSENKDSILKSFDNKKPDSKDWLKVDKGQFTFDREGTHPISLTIHWPGTAESGVTIGRGYDIGQWDVGRVIDDLEDAGLSTDNAKELAKTAKLKGQNAKNFVILNKDKEWATITLEQQYNLFVNIYSYFVKQAEDSVNNALKWGIEFDDGSIKMYPPDRPFNKLPQEVKDVASDMAYNVGESEFRKNNWGGIFQMDNWQEMADYIKGNIEGYILDANKNRKRNNEGEFLRAETILAKWRDQVKSRVDEIVALLESAPPIKDKHDFAKLIGIWNGTYIANQGETSLLLHIKPDNTDNVIAEFHFGATARNANVPSGSFYMDLLYDHETKAIEFFGTEWINKPASYYMLDMKGVLDYSDNTIIGDMYQAINDPMPRGNEKQGSFVLSKIHDSLYVTDFNAINGYWFGTYRSSTPERSLLLYIKYDEDQNIQGEFNFGPTTRNSRMPRGKFLMEVIYDQDANDINLYGVEWEKRPSSYYMIDLSGSVDIDNANMSGGFCFAEKDPPPSGYTGQESGQFHLNRASLFQEAIDDGTNAVSKENDEDDDVCFIKTLIRNNH